MKKRGISHIEMIMAFILFIGVVAFVFIFLNPFATTNPTLATGKYALNELSNLLKTNITTYTLIMDGDAVVENQIDGKVIIINLGFQIPPTANVHAENYSGSILPSGISSDREDIYLNWSKKNSRVVLLSLSEEFEAFTPPPSDPLPLDETNYQIASSVFSEAVSEKKAADAVIEYSNYYSVLKKELNIPPQADFGFKLSLPEKDYAANKTIPANIEVKSRNKIVRVVRLDGNQSLGNLEVSVW